MFRRFLQFPSLFLLSTLALAQTAQSHLKLTDVMTPAQFNKCGLQKLSSAELEALNDWITTLVVPNTDSNSSIKGHTTAKEGEITLYDSRGVATAYIDTDDDNTIFTWTGKPVAYLDEENVYGFNGKHLGWFQDGKIYDHQGRIAGTTADAATVTLQFEPFKGFKQFKPFKAFKEFAPLQPIFTFSASRVPLAVLLAQGGG